MRREEKEVRSEEKEVMWEMWGLASPPRPQGRGSHPCTRESAGRFTPCSSCGLACEDGKMQGEVRSEKRGGRALHRKWLIYL